MDPCSLVTPQLRAQLYRLTAAADRTQTKDGLSSSDCAWTNGPLAQPGVSLALRLVTSQAVAYNLQFPEAQVTSVAGFGAVDMPGAHDITGNRGCVVRIDVAETESLWVIFGNVGEDIPGRTFQMMCDKAHLAAESVMQQLLARQR